MKYLRLLLGCLLSWWPMMVFHEFGHVIGCLFSDAKIERVVLWPWAISQTVRSHSRAPLVDTWCGPVLGALLPLFVYLVLTEETAMKRRMGFFAGFCLLANGLYIGAGAFDEAGDAGELLNHQVPLASLCLFGAVTATAGFFIWHRELFRHSKRISAGD